MYLYILGIYIHICIIFGNTHTYIKCSLFSPYVHVFRTDQLALDNQLTFFSLGRASFPVPRFAQLPIVHCVELRPHGPSLM